MPRQDIKPENLIMLRHIRTFHLRNGVLTITFDHLLFILFCAAFDLVQIRSEREAELARIRMLQMQISAQSGAPLTKSQKKRQKQKQKKLLAKCVAEFFLLYSRLRSLLTHCSVALCTSYHFSLSPLKQRRLHRRGL